MDPWYTDDTATVYAGDCLDVLAELDDASIDAVVTDPPYGIVFMGKHWDDHVTPAGFQTWCELWAVECLRVLKPGGHMLAFGGTRTSHRLACAIEDAGFEVRDSIAWIYGSGFPKSLDVSKAIDKAAGAEREVVAEGAAVKRMIPGADQDKTGSWIKDNGREFIPTVTAPATPDAAKWQGWGTALKPAHEPIVVARKPLAGTVAANVLTYGTGALNIDATRIASPDNDGKVWTRGGGSLNARGGPRGAQDGAVQQNEHVLVAPNPAGRWPANVVLDESQAAELDRQSGTTTAGAAGKRGSSGFVDGYDGEYDVPYGDTGGASRFFYVAKAGTDERPRGDGVAHPTVKPVDLMRWLVRLVTPPGGVVLDPFLGSGTTAEACVVEGFRCVGIEREADYLPLIRARITKPIAPVMF